MSLNYETAVKLREAGFPQEGNGKYSKITDGLPINFITTRGNLKKFEEFDCYVPTLSELIEACGDEFGELRRDIGCGGHCEEWTAKNYHRTKHEMDFSPEEAVSALWLEINKK